MGSWLIRRLLATAVIILAVLTLTFVAIHLAPGTPFMPGDNHPGFDTATIERLNVRYGLDRSLPVQYSHYLRGLARGEFGESFRQRRPVVDMLAEAIPNTILLTGTALAIELILGLVIGVIQAARAGRTVDLLLTNATLLFYSIPTFWLGLVLLMTLGTGLHWFPVGGMVDPAIHTSLGWWGRTVDVLHHLVLPAATLGVVGAAATARFQRAATINALREEFVRTARAKGISSKRILWRHVLRNALLPYVTIIGLALPALLTGSVVVEYVFAWPGMGRLAADAIATRDYPVVMATSILATTMVVLGSLVADLLHAAADPRTREPETA